MRQFETAPGPQLPPRRSVRQIMGRVLLALLPGVIAQAWLFGPGVLMQIALACGFALLLEAAMLAARGRPLRPFLGDLSAPLAAVLFALAMPPLAPWWIAAIGMVAAMVFAKHLYGGLGHNLFNPAMVGVAVVLVCFPLEYSQWLPPSLLVPALPGWSDSLQAIWQGELPPPWRWDALAQATPLDSLRQLSRAGQTLGEIRQAPVFGQFGGRGWEIVAAAYAVGGLLLIWLRLIPWQTPAAVIAGTLLLSLPWWLLDPDLHPAPLQQVFSGALLLAAFFIATDPVTGCTTPRGRWLFGFGVAALTLIIRRWSSYPDGVAFAVLLMNCLAPLIDRYSRPRIFGEPRS